MHNICFLFLNLFRKSIQKYILTYALVLIHKHNPNRLLSILALKLTFEMHSLITG